MTKKQHMISKSSYVESYNCSKKMWLSHHKPFLKEEMTEAEKLNIEDGNQVGSLAITHVDFSGGVLIDTKNKKVAAEDTKKALKNKDIKFIYEATFIVNNLIVQVDILQKNDNNTFDIIEVKASGKVKKHYLIDVAFQRYVLSQSNLIVEKTFLMHLNRDYSFSNSLDLKGLFFVEDVSAHIGLYFNEVEEKVKSYVSFVNEKVEPVALVGSHCKTPHKCPYYKYCHKSINEDSVEKLSRLSTKKRTILSNENIKYIKDISGVVKNKLTHRQNIQLQVATDNSTHIEKAAIKDFLSQLVFPLNHLDFEATNRAIPIFDGMHPNQFVVYQASIHLEQKNRAVQHFSFLHLNNNDPRKNLISFLLENLNNSGSIVVWNKSFEATRIKELASQFPEYSDKLLSLIPRMIDLAIVFQKTWLYNHCLQGSASIKYVLPFLVPELSYDRLFIRNGTDSQAFYVKMLKKDFKGGMYNKVKKGLLEYNRLDTWSMLAIRRRLASMVGLKVSNQVVESV
jgi:predicted RecB family nuclease